MATKKSAKSAVKKATKATKKAVRASKPKAAPSEEKAKKKPKGGRGSKSAFVNKLLDVAEKKVTAEDMKASIGDVIRLLQLQKELEQEEPREITVQWIEREGKKPAAEE